MLADCVFFRAVMPYFCATGDKEGEKKESWPEPIKDRNTTWFVHDNPHLIFV